MRHAQKNAQGRFERSPEAEILRAKAKIAKERDFLEKENAWMRMMIAFYDAHPLVGRKRTWPLSHKPQPTSTESLMRSTTA